jgi:hypothetical protein
VISDVTIPQGPRAGQDKIEGLDAHHIQGTMGQGRGLPTGLPAPFHVHLHQVRLPNTMVGGQWPPAGLPSIPTAHCAAGAGEDAPRARRGQRPL